MKKTLVYLCAVLSVSSAIISCSGGGGGGNSDGSNLPPEINANITGLHISDGTLSPSFDKDTTTYTVEVDNTVKSITVMPTSDAESSTITVNGFSVTSGKSSPSIDLPNTGSTVNKITIIVTASDKMTTKTYTVNVSRVALSSNANLAGLVLSTGTLSPKFDPLTLNYSVEVPYTKTSMALTPTVAGVGAMVTVNGSLVPAGTISQNIALANTGSIINPISIVVTAQDGTKKIYTVNVTRTALSSNANLAGLTVSAGTLIPLFDVDTVNYTLSVENSISAFTVTPTTASSFAAVIVNSSTVISGNESQSVPLTVGSNEITIVVTAQDGTTKTYTVNVTRADNANLSGISVSKGKLQPSFSPSTTSYLDAPVPFSDNANPAYNDTQSASITVTVAVSDATVTINGNPVESGNAYTMNNLSIGSNIANVVVTAKDGIAKKSYKVDVYRAVPIYKTGAGVIREYTLDTREDGYTKRGVSWPTTRFTVGSESITDNMTSLVWLKTPSTVSCTWNDGITLCEGLSNSNGDWRMPNLYELRSLANYGDVDGLWGWLNSQGFSIAQYDFYWSSTSYVPYQNSAWGVLMDRGGVGPSLGAESNKRYVWPVRAESNLLATGQTAITATGDDGYYHKGLSSPSIRFYINGDSTITDNLTGLVWLNDETLESTFITWYNALEYITKLNSGKVPGNCGHSDWRLPNINELESLINYSQTSASNWLYEQGFTNITSHWYWSSTTFAWDTYDAWYIRMDYGLKNSWGKADQMPMLILPVRGK